MSIFHDSSDARRHGLPGADCPILQSLELYWQSLRHSRHIPARNEIAPHMIDAALPHAFILQRVAPGVARMRVAGQRIHDLLRMDARGMPVSVLFAPDSRDRMRDLVETAFTQPAIVAASLLSAGQIFRPALPATIMMLPMRDERGEVSRVLGALVCDASPANRARRFDLVPDRTVRIDSLAITLASSQPAPAPLPEPIAPQPQRPDMQRPALRLVVDNG
ncbi:MULTISPECIES: PAS domain-containing protein [unclassified Yoonia]|uniref:PAS domain-containing protein n=1 Tax=unclassified Yoonia TaxID=2629118 RepID=UPI002AFEE734|nr:MULTISPECIES: PAS domain-containing protein [unclassified Yoonia]